MIDFAPADLDMLPEWRLVLDAYVGAEAAHKQAKPDFDGWVPRLPAISGVQSDRLSQVHGKLIAHGLLSFQLTGRTAGMAYQVSPLAREALQRALGIVIEDSTINDDDGMNEA